MTDAEATLPEPRGVIAIMTQPNGNVIATAADFSRNSYGGFKIWEAQRLRVREAVMRNTVRAYCSNIVADVSDNFLIRQIAEALIDRGGHKISLRAVGYPDDVKNSIEG